MGRSAPDGRHDPEITPALSLTFEAIPASATAARRCLGTYLERIGFPPARVADACVAAGEAIANVIEHAYAAKGPGETFSLRAFVADAQVHIEIFDRGFWNAGISAALDERGRGVMLMYALSDDVRIEHDRAGTRIRLAFDFTGAA